MKLLEKIFLAPAFMMVMGFMVFCLYILWQEFGKQPLLFGMAIYLTIL